MKRPSIRNGAVIVGLLALGGAAGYVVSRAGAAEPQERYVTIKANKYAYDPPVLRVNRGDRIHLSLVSGDVTHGFFLEGYDLDAQIPPGDFNFKVRRPSKGPEYKSTDEVSFVATKSGKFRYRCSNTCGYMHPFMQGEMIVSPNSLYPTSAGMLFGLAVSMLWVSRRD